MIDSRENINLESYILKRISKVKDIAKLMIEVQDRPIN